MFLGYILFARPLCKNNFWFNQKYHNLFYIGGIMRGFRASITFVVASVTSVLASVAAQASPTQPTRQEFLEWVGDGELGSYVYVCTVKANNGTLSLRVSPGGERVGTLRNGYDFDLGDVRSAADGSTWYRVNPFNGRTERGWVAAKYVQCEAMHLG
jgi:hypothetical protein